MEPNVPSPATATPKYRWRIVVGLISLATMALLVWMLWPAALNNVEKKFVGTWTRQDSPGSIFILFHSDRTASYHKPKMPSRAGWWWADEDSLYFDEGFKDAMSVKISMIRHGGPDHNRYTLLSVDEECFRMFVPVNGTTHEWTRVPCSSAAPLPE